MSEIMTLREVADYLRVHPTTIYRMLKGHYAADGAIPVFKVGADYRFIRADVDAWMRGKQEGKK